MNCLKYLYIFIIQDMPDYLYNRDIPELNDKPKRGDRIDCTNYEKNQKRNQSHAV